MTPHKLEQIGQLLYGPSWRAALAISLNVAERTVRRWMGGSPIPDTIAADLASICRRRIKELQKAAESLE